MVIKGEELIFADTTIQVEGHAQLVEALRYKPEGCGFNSQWRHWNFHRHNPSGHTMALGSTQPLTEMSTRNISWEVTVAGA